MVAIIRGVGRAPVVSGLVDNVLAALKTRAVLATPTTQALVAVTDLAVAHAPAAVVSAQVVVHTPAVVHAQAVAVILVAAANAEQSPVKTYLQTFF